MMARDAMIEDGLLCEFVGHSWVEAGGGLEICDQCQAERWAPEEEHDRLEAV